MAKVALIIPVVYDESKTDSEALAVGFDKLLKTVWGMAGADFCDDYGKTTPGEFYVSTQNPDHVHKPDLTTGIEDDAHMLDDSNTELIMRIKEEGYGVSVAAEARDGTHIGEVVLDYHDNKLRGLVYEALKDEPVVSHWLCDDVYNAIRKTTNAEDQKENEEG